MTFNDLDIKRIENAMATFLAKRRPPPHIRPELDIGYRLNGQSIEIFEIRPQWDNPSIIREHPFAKATFVVGPAKPCDTFSGKDYGHFSTK